MRVGGLGVGKALWDVERREVLGASPVDLAQHSGHVCVHVLGSHNKVDDEAAKAKLSTECKTSDQQASTTA
jgi:hypothetical protein